MPRTADHYRGLHLGLRLLRIGPVLILLILVAVLGILSPFFLTTRNLGNVLAATAAIAVLSLGQLLVILTRGIDLSVGSTLALASVVGCPRLHRATTRARSCWSACWPPAC